MPGYGISTVKTLALFPLCGVSNFRVETEKNYARVPNARVPNAPVPYSHQPYSLFPLTKRLIQQTLFILPISLIDWLRIFTSNFALAH